MMKPILACAILWGAYTNARAADYVPNTFPTDLRWQPLIETIKVGFDRQSWGTCGMHQVYGLVAHPVTKKMPDPRFAIESIVVDGGGTFGPPLQEFPLDGGGFQELFVALGIPENDPLRGVMTAYVNDFLVVSGPQLRGRIYVGSMQAFYSTRLSLAAIFDEVNGEVVLLGEGRCN